MAPLLQTVPAAFRTEPLKGSLRAHQDLSASLNPLVRGSLLKSEADSLFFVVVVLLPTVYIFYLLWHSTRPKKEVDGRKKRTLNNKFSVGWRKCSFQK